MINKKGQEGVSWRTIGLILAIFMIVILMFGGIGAIKKALQSFMSIGEEESTELTKIKEDCNKLYDKSDSPSSTCAFSVAEKLLKENGNPLEIEKWIRSQIGNSNSDLDILKKTLDLSKQLYSQSKDWRGAVKTYDILNKRLNTEETKLLLADATTEVAIEDIKIYDQTVFSETKDVQYLYVSSTKQQLADNYSSIVATYRENPNLPDKLILGHSQTGLESCNMIFEIGNLPPAPATLSERASICNTILRASAKYACYYVPLTEGKGFQCGSCITYQPVAREGVQASDLCTGYTHRWSCETNPCDIPSRCVWDEALFTSGVCKTST